MHAARLVAAPGPPLVESASDVEPCERRRARDETQRADRRPCGRADGLPAFRLGLAGARPAQRPGTLGRLNVRSGRPPRGRRGPREQGVGDAQRRQQAEHVAVGAAGQHDDALLRGRALATRRSARRPGSVVPGVDQLDGEHRAAAADVADPRVVGLRARAAAPSRAPRSRGRGRPGRRPRWSRSPPARRRRRAGCRRRCRRGRRRAAASIISARPVTAESGRPPAMPLAVTMRSGTTPSWSQANMSPVRAKPVCTSSATKHDAVGACTTRPGRAGSPGAGTMNPPSPWIGSITTAARLAAPTCFSMHVDRPAPRPQRRRGRRRGTGRTAARGRPRRRTARSRACRACTWPSSPS